MRVLSAHLVDEPDGVATEWRQKGEYRKQESWRCVVSIQITIEQQTSLLQKPDGSPVKLFACHRRTAI